MLRALPMRSLRHRHRHRQRQRDEGARRTPLRRPARLWYVARMTTFSSTPDRRPMTLTQKILAAKAVGLTRPYVQAGDVLRVRVDWTIASELAWNGMDKTYQALGRPPLKNAERFFLAVGRAVGPAALAGGGRARGRGRRARGGARGRGRRRGDDAN